MKVKRTLLLIAAGCGAAAFAIQQSGQKHVILDDRKGGFKIYNVDSYELGLVPNSGDLRFDATGAPVRGFSKEQGLNFSANRIAGTAARSDGGSMRITNGRMTGNVVFDIAKSEGGQTDRSHLESASVTLAEEATQARITLPSAFTFTNHVVTPTVDRQFTIRAPSGVFVLPPLNQTSGQANPFRSADVKGPINVSLDSKQTSSAGTSRHEVELRGDRLTYDGASRTLLLEGNIVADVKITPTKGEPLEFTQTGGWARVLFNEDSSVKDVVLGAGTGVLRSGGGQ
jgi:hypothetical protein